MELNGLYFRCHTCELRQEAKRTNISVYIYEQEPLFNFIEFRCACGEEWRVFGMNSVIDSSDLSTWRVLRTLTAPASIKKAYSKVYDKNMPDEEALIAEFHETLVQIQTPDEIDWSDHGQEG